MADVNMNISTAPFGKKHVVRAKYSVAADGGSVGTHKLVKADGREAYIPAGAIVTRTIIKPSVAAASSGLATIAIGLAATNDLLAATAFDASPFSGTAFVAGIQDNAVGNFLAITANKRLTVTVAVAAITALTMEVIVEYIAAQ